MHYDLSTLVQCQSCIIITTIMHSTQAEYSTYFYQNAIVSSVEFFFLLYIEGGEEHVNGNISRINCS